MEEYATMTKTEKRIYQNRYKSNKWNELYLKTFHATDIEMNAITNETIIYHARRIACIVLNANARRSGSEFDRRLHLSACGYDVFKGTQEFYNVGGEDIVQSAMTALSVMYEKGYLFLHDEVTEGRDVFVTVCTQINREILAMRHFRDSASLDDIAHLSTISARIATDTTLDTPLSMELLDILEHLKLTPIMHRYLEYITLGFDVREIATAEDKHHSTVQEGIRAIRKKFFKHCTDNGINPEKFQFLTEYTE